MKRTSTPPCGYSGDTEILTRSGWTAFPQLTYMSEVATRSPDGRFEWQFPERITCQRYDGPMVWFQSRTTNLLVMPEHPVRYYPRRRDFRNGQRTELPRQESVALASSLVGCSEPPSLVATSRWEPAAFKTEIVFEPTRAQTYGGRLARKGYPFRATAEVFAAFMGAYLSEGSLGRANATGYHRIDIWQTTKGKGFVEYQELLNRMLGREVPWHSKGLWHFQNKALYYFLETCGGYAWTKEIPPQVLDLAAPALETFWKFYFLGDGTIMNTGSDRKPLEVISTTSPRMASQLQEILQKLGGWGLIQIIDMNKYSTTKGRQGHMHLTHRLVRRAGTVASATKVERVPYQGLVGNVHVGGRAVYVRRNYRPVWAGAS